MSENKPIEERLLQEAQEEIESVLNANNLSKAEETILRSQKITLHFIEEDHKKTKALYTEYEERNKRRGLFEKLAIPVATSLIIIFLSQAYWFWVDIVPKINNLP